MPLHSLSSFPWSHPLLLPTISTEFNQLFGSSEKSMLFTMREQRTRELCFFQPLSLLFLIILVFPFQLSLHILGNFSTHLLLSQRIILGTIPFAISVCVFFPFSIVLCLFVLPSGIVFLFL